MDGDIFHADGTPLAIDGLDATINRTDFIIVSSGVAICTLYLDGTYSINPDLTAEEYRRSLEMVIEYFTKGKK